MCCRTDSMCRTGGNRIAHLIFVVVVLFLFPGTSSASSIAPPLDQTSPVQNNSPVVKDVTSVSSGGASTPPAAIAAASVSPFAAQPNDDPIAIAPRKHREALLSQQQQQKDHHLVTFIAAKLISICTAIYGIALLIHGLPTFRAQIHVLTMMRASGARKIERCITKVRRNFRDAYWRAVRNSPSLYYANRSIRRIDGRIAAARAIMAETRKAQADGKITPREQRRINRMKRRYIRRLRGDAMRLRKAKSSLGQVFEAMDLPGIWDLFKEFAVTMTTVMSSGHNSQQRFGKVVCNYCHFLNLGSLVCEANRRIGFPVSRFFWTGEFIDSDLDDEDHKGIAITGGVVSYLVSAYLILRHHELALRLSAALLASAIILRGFSSVAMGRDGSLEELEFFRHKPDQRLVGVAMIGLAIFGMRYSHLGYDGIAENDVSVHKIFWPLFGVEKAIGGSLHALRTLATPEKGMAPYSPYLLRR